MSQDSDFEDRDVGVRCRCKCRRKRWRQKVLIGPLTRTQRITKTTGPHQQHVLTSLMPQKPCFFFAVHKVNWTAVLRFVVAFTSSWWRKGV